MALRRLVCLLSLFCVSATFFGDEPSLSTANNGSFGVGKTCKYNTDCMEGAHCTQGSCKCWHTHVELDGFCWKKIGPDEIGCQHNLQCDAMWPESHCILGTCRCPIGQVAAITRDGTVCHQMGHCPTNGANPILFSRNKDTPAECFFYDRTTARFIGCDDYPDLYDCIAGICCPTRSFACAQPMDKGTRFDSAQPMVMRWYFDASLGSCQQFEFTGLGGNANNFETKRNCEAYCGNGCPRGQPQAGVSCGSGNGTTCHPNFKCINNLCCPDTAYICSEYGGLGGDSADLSKPSILPPYNIGSSKSGAAPAQRYHFDRTSKTCKTFSYLGQGGNFNNFATEKQCSEFCARTMCPAGNPLKLENGSSVQCSTDSQCPRTHYCVGGHCCPTSATICNQPLNTGAACNSEPTVRYGFNPIEGVCEKFTYNGCHGNENNFGTLEACTSICDRVEEEPKCVQGDALKLESGKFWRCGASQSKQQSCPKDYECHFDGRTHGCCPTRAFTCAQKADNGTLCDPGKSMRWYFDADAHICLTFEYGGCDGNSNNFPNRESCEQHCDVSVCPGGGRVQRTDYGKTVECDDSNPCAEGFSCTRLSNPLAFQSSGTKYCCPSRLAICSEKASAGVACSEAEIRYSFSPKDGGCRPFKYNGCGGNSNSFLSRQSCQQFCAASSCAMDEIVYFDGRSSDGPFDCSEKLCPDGFQCVKDVLKPSRNVCCGQPSFEVCPSKERPILDHITGKPLSCSQSIPTSCPHGTFCRQNEKRNQAYCCEKQVERPKCSNGWKAVLNSITSSSYGCSSDPQCPGTDAKCHGASQQQSGICCVTDNDVCPPLFSLDVTRTAASQCNPLAVDSCAADHSSVCMFSEKMNRFVCCQRDPRPDLTIQACPGSMAQDEQKSTCSFRTPCPVPYSCIRKNADMKGICCRHVQGRAVVKVKIQCPRGEKPLFQRGTVKECNDKTQCPHPYKCKLNRVMGSKTRICCRSVQSDLPSCPEGTVPLSMNGVAQTCRDTCPEGFSCHRGFCCSTRNLCPHPYISRHSSLHLCNPFSDNCKEHERCVRGSTKEWVCCGAPKVGTLRGLLSQICDEGFRPEIRENGEPKACASRSHCQVGHICHYSSVLQSSVCCMKSTGAEETPQIPYASDELQICAGGQCWKAFQPMEKGCFMDRQCLGGSLCVDGLCLCPHNTVPDGVICRH